MRAEPTHADPAAGPHAFDAPLFAEVAGLAFTALIDGVVPAGPGRRHRGWFGLGGGVPAAPRCSTTGVAAVGQRATAFGTPLLAGTASRTPFLAPSATGRGAAGRRPSARSWRWCQSATRHRGVQ